MNVNDILLAQNIHRWTIVATKTRQSLAEHLFNTAMIARDIAGLMGIEDGRIIKYALDHDLDEVMTGDIPSPAKDRLNIDAHYNGKSKHQCTPLELLVVKAADIIDAYLFIKHNHFDRHGKIVYGWNEEKVESFMADIEHKHPSLFEAMNDTLSMLEFGKYDCEDRDE